MFSKCCIVFIETDKKAKQLGKPKTPNTMSHIPVTVSRRERNSQEDAHGVARKENAP